MSYQFKKVIANPIYSSETDVDDPKPQQYDTLVSTSVYEDPQSLYHTGQSSWAPAQRHRANTA